MIVFALVVFIILPIIIFCLLVKLANRIYKIPKINETTGKRNIKKVIVNSLLIVLLLTVSGFIMVFGLFVLRQGQEKPIIYLYPKQETSLTVKLGNPENISCSYPKYTEDGWQVIAKPDGTLTDIKTGKELYSLYWEGKKMNNVKMTDGFVVKGDDVAGFLEEKLKILGLNPKESEEFIIYWLPRLESNKYNHIRFASMDEINESMPLEFSVNPDSIIRVLMQYKALNNYVEVPEQKLTTPERTGFVAVEWGGLEVK